MCIILTHLVIGTVQLQWRTLAQTNTIFLTFCCVVNTTFHTALGCTLHTQLQYAAQIYALNLPDSLQEKYNIEL